MQTIGRIILVLLAASALAASALAAPAVAADPDLDAARLFVEQVYRAYCGTCEVPFERRAPRLLSRSLLALVVRDRRATPDGDVGALDGDPICDCQDHSISGVRVVAQEAGAGRATAVAEFRNFGEPQTVRLDLVIEKGGWRIDNIHTAGTPDLAAYLRAHAGGR
jgi:hypothetical protein